jgi:hypothetical protein
MGSVSRYSDFELKHQGRGLVAIAAFPMILELVFRCLMTRLGVLDRDELSPGWDKPERPE